MLLWRRGCGPKARAVQRRSAVSDNSAASWGFITASCRCTQARIRASRSWPPRPSSPSATITVKLPSDCLSSTATPQEPAPKSTTARRAPTGRSRTRGAVVPGRRARLTDQPQPLLVNPCNLGGRGESLLLRRPPVIGVRQHHLLGPLTHDSLGRGQHLSQYGGHHIDHWDEHPAQGDLGLRHSSLRRRLEGQRSRRRGLHGCLPDQEDPARWCTTPPRASTLRWQTAVPHGSPPRNRDTPPRCSTCRNPPTTTRDASPDRPTRSDHTIIPCHAMSSTDAGSRRQLLPGNCMRTIEVVVSAAGAAVAARYVAGSERVSVEASDRGLWMVGRRYFPSSTASNTSSECLKGADVTPVSVPNG